MHLQLVDFADRYGTTHPAAAAYINSYEAGFPPQAEQHCHIFIYVSESAHDNGAQPIFDERQDLMFNPNSSGAELAAYNQLADKGGIYEGSTVQGIGGQ